MRRSVGVFIAITLVALLGVIGIAFSQGKSELANPNKIVHGLVGDKDESKRSWRTSLGILVDRHTSTSIRLTITAATSM